MIGRQLKKCLPRSLFGRALLILFVPTLLVQIIGALFFYERHWDSVVRHMSNSVVREVTYIYEAYNVSPDEESLKQAKYIARQMGMHLTFDDAQNDISVRDYSNSHSHNEFVRQLKRRIADPFIIHDKDKEIELRILMEDGTLVFDIPRKRLASVTTYVFVMVLVGTSTVLMIIATLFLRNQIRPIVQLARAAEQFGIGRDDSHYSPRGAREVRMAGASFMRMRERIKRQVETRTQMLAGISHDLRTPLTRMKLELALASKSPDALEHINNDVVLMEHMIEEYLAFARGSSGEQSTRFDMRPWLEEIVGRYAKHDKPVTMLPCDDIEWVGRPNAITRAVQNVIDNALRYGESARLHMTHNDTHIYIMVEDDGPGIDEDKLDQVFQPFRRLDASRNLEQGGVGLGLTIAQDIVHVHGGRLTLSNRKKGGKVQGLTAEIKLPRAQIEEMA